MAALANGSPHLGPSASSQAHPTARRVSLSRRLSASVVPPALATQFAESFQDAMATTTLGDPVTAQSADILPNGRPGGAATATTAQHIAEPLVATSPWSRSHDAGRPASSMPLQTPRTTPTKAQAPSQASPSFDYAPPLPQQQHQQPQQRSATVTAPLTLRARRASLSHSRPPSASLPSPSLPTTTPRKEVGLGLMLDASSSPSAASPVVGGSAAARARDMLTRLGLDDDLPSSAAIDAGGEWKSRIPRVSTNTSGSPLLVYTGTTPLLAASVTSPSSYLPSSSSSLLTPKSSAMDRSSSGSSSHSSIDMHSRHSSLTSACPPVTSSVAPSPSPSASPTSLRSYWGRHGGEKGGNDDDPRKGAKASSGASSPTLLASLLALPSNLLAVILTPLTATIPTPLSSSSSSPGGNGSNGGASNGPLSPGARKRYPFLFRLVTLLYLLFSCVFLAVRLLSPSAYAPKLATGLRLGPRASELVLGGTAVGGLADADDDARRFILGRVGEGVGGWAQKVAGGVVGWPPAGAVGNFEDGSDGDTSGPLSPQENAVVPEWGTVKRIGNPADDSAQTTTVTNPLAGLTHPYRLAKMHDKVHWDLPDEIEPYLFRATGAPPEPNDITACYYSNEAWIGQIPAFVEAWGGPVSLVFEAAHSRSSPERQRLMRDIAALRAGNAQVRELVDFHLVGTPAAASERSLNHTRERLLLRPTAFNFHSNLARFFAPTDVVYLVGDARVVPSVGLRVRLRADAVQSLVLGKGDAIVVPTFGFVRDLTGEGYDPPPTVASLREHFDLPVPAGEFDGVGPDEFLLLGAAHISDLYSTLPIPAPDWPQKKASLVTLVRTRVGTPDHPSDATLALFDRRWDLNHGPTNWYLWRKSATDSRLLEPPELGGGIGLGVDGTVGGGKDVFRVTDYDLHYAPSVVVSRKGQPWCTERFDTMPAACVYQMYLTGAELWVLPDEWAFTIEPVDKVLEPAKMDPAEKLKNSISSRLYGKFHQEACMHHGREFLSVEMWDSDKAQHLRSVCARTLGTWGMGP